MRGVRNWRRGPWFVLATCCAIAIGCGGGGGGGGPEIQPQTLPLYEFGIGETNGGEPFEVSFSEGGGNFSVAVMFPGTGMRGTVEPGDGDHTIAAGSMLDVDSDVGDPLFGVFDIDVTTTINVPNDDWADTGTYEVHYGGDTTEVSFQGSSVRVIHDGGAPEIYSWDNFEDMVGSPAETYLQRAALAWGILEFMLDTSDVIAQTFELMEEDLYYFNPMSHGCDGIAPLTPPGWVSMDTGNHVFGWNDVNFDDDMGPGDNFSWYFDMCWREEDGGGEGEFWRSGTMQLLNFTEVVSGGAYTRVGYEPFVDDGGVFFNDVLVYETEGDGPNLEIDAPRYLNGSFQIAWWAP
ncbi:MAG: hypothetical protein QNJ90_09865 [Planctomycetota bacterium]|nr:hypothetical protein [Planctomycetota bacterium]